LAVFKARKLAPFFTLGFAFGSFGSRLRGISDRGIGGEYSSPL
jgi:hypothetical protein